MNLLFAEPLPLRTTRDLGDYAENLPLPHRIGNLSQSRFNLIKLSASKWFAADHPMVIDQVFIGAQETAGWNYKVESDGRGHSWTVVNLAAPAPDGEAVSATGIGKLDERTGALIENPGDVFAYIARLAGRSERWDALRAESAGIRLALSLTDAASIRTYLSRVARSAGAIWTPQMARLYPTADIVGPVLELERWDVPELSVSAVLTDTCDVLRLAYDVEEATGRPLRHMEFSASPQRLGGAVLELTLPYVRSPADAETIGRREMVRFAGETFAVSGVIGRTDVRPGAWVKIVDHPQWPLDGDDPTLMVLAVDVARNKKAAGFSGEFVRSAPTVSITAHSIALPDTTQGGVDVEFRNGVASIRITDVNGQPIKDARVALDSGAPHQTNVDGVASFIASRGTHTLSVEAPGFAAEALQIEL